MLRASVLVAIVVVATAQPALAQCADGSPPPCRAQTVASATRRADPPLDDKTWIVVPFDNLNNNQDVDWLRSGSVNLLYLGLSRWTDLRVIDDERVADYMREVPGAADARSVSLTIGLAIAKRAGARNLVMGDLLKLGNRTTVNAKIYDVRTGQRVRSVREETLIADSLMSMYGKLAQKVLSIAPPPGSSAGVVGTSSIAAYQAYAEGMQAMNRFDMPSAERQFNRALTLDSTFALAHAKLSVLIGWISPTNTAALRHAEAAGRLSSTLPLRERSLIDASVAFARRDYPKACAGFRALVARDSTDTDAWYGLGDCLFHDNAVEPVPSDTTRFRFRSSRSESVRAFRTTLNLDRTYHLAYQHILDAYTSPQMGGARCVENRCTNFIAIVRPSGDSLLTEPIRPARDTSLLRQHMDDLVRNRARVRLYETARAFGSQWIAANPNESRAQLMYAAALLLSGMPQQADSLIRRFGGQDSTAAATNASLASLETSIKLYQADRARFLFDSIQAHPTAIPGAGGVTTGRLGSVPAPILGRLAAYDSLIAIGIRQANAPASRLSISLWSSRATLGFPADSLVFWARTVTEELKVQLGSALAATRLMAPLLGFALSTNPQDWPALDTTVTEVRSLPAVAAWRRDTTAMRRAARALDSVSAALGAALVPDTGMAVMAATAYLALGDSTRALAMARRWLDVILPYSPITVGSTGNLNIQVLMPRAMMMRADLAAAAGARDEARLWYDRLIAFWSGADAELQPVVERLRKSRAALGP